MHLHVHVSLDEHATQGDMQDDTFRSNPIHVTYLHWGGYCAIVLLLHDGPPGTADQVDFLVHLTSTGG